MYIATTLIYNKKGGSCSEIVFGEQYAADENIRRLEVQLEGDEADVLEIIGIVKARLSGQTAYWSGPTTDSEYNA